MNTFEARLQVKEGARPRFCKARPVPFALKAAIDRELDRLENEGILEPVTYSEWAAPVVPVPKTEGQIRLCGDYKVTINPVLEVDQYPLPKPDNIFATLSTGKVFSKIDLTHAYQQMKLTEDSRNYVTINTHRGLFRYTRLPFGVASAPSIFQKVMDTVLQGLPNAICYLDDILVSGATKEEHLHNLEMVLQRLEQYNIRAKKAKCAFMCDAVEYLGHRIDADGLHTLSSKVKAIQDAPQPQNVQELRSFLGLLHYYGKFLPNLATLLHPLNALLKTGSKWLWSAECSDAFKAAKRLLAHYNPSLPIRLAGDASAYGIGAVISHVFEDGSERPVAFTSRTLSPTERNYPQIEKEALSLIYGIQKFHQYLYGRPFVLVTDHRPLLSILGPKKGIPPLAAARMQRWALLLSAYNYSIEFRPTAAHANADGLSRLPLGTRHPASTDSIFTIGQIQALPVTAEQIATATRQDVVLSRVLNFVKEGWPEEVSKELEPFARRQHELSTEANCLLWGIRVIIPKKYQAQLLEELHSEHQGVSRMKALARSYPWWPGLDKELEECARNCHECQSVKNSPAVAPLHPWLWPSKPWQRVHIDFAGPFQNKMYLIVIDAHSKWPEVIEMTTTTSHKTITELQRLFSMYGIPTQLVSDNGPQFTSEEFASFMKRNGIKHIRSAPYHPSTNGTAKRFVQTKKAMKALRNSSLTQTHRLYNFLLTYRTTPHDTTNEPPCQLFMGRMLRTRWTLLKPDLEQTVVTKQANQKDNHDKHAKPRELCVGDTVMANNPKPGFPAVSAIIKKRLGPLTYLVETQSGQLWKHHIDHLRSVGTNISSSVTEELQTGDIEMLPTVPTESNTSTEESSTVPANATPIVTGRRYPQREHRPPLWYRPES